jgi:hypothetical protein
MNEQGPNLDLPEIDPEKHWEEWEDMLGRGYGPGSIVAYAATVGRSSGMTVGMVRRINKHDSRGKQLTKNIGNWQDPEYVPWATVTICPLRDSNNRWRYTNRDVTISPDKIVVLDVSLAEVL